MLDLHQRQLLDNAQYEQANLAPPQKLRKTGKTAVAKQLNLVEEIEDREDDDMAVNYAIKSGAWDEAELKALIDVMSEILAKKEKLGAVADDDASSSLLQRHPKDGCSEDW